MRKKILVFSALALFLSQALFAGTFNPDELNKVTFTNSTTRAITAIFFAPSDSGDWGPDLLGSETTLGARQSRSFYVHYPDSTGTFDIMAIDDNGKTLQVMGFVMHDGREEKVTFTAKNMKADMPEFDYMTLKVKNDTGYDIHYLFMSPSDSNQWGADILDEETILAKGQTISLIVPSMGSTVEYNVMAADEDGDLYKFDIKLNPAKGSEWTATIDIGDLE